MSFGIAALLAATTPVLAQEASDPGILDAGGYLDADNPDLVFSIRLGGQAARPYFGSDDIELGPDVGFRFDFVQFPNGLQYSSGNSVGFGQGWGLRGSARYIPERDSTEYSELAGLDDVDWAWELGLGAGYEAEDYRFYGVVRYGLIGHNAFVGEIGADYIVRPADGWTLTAGPRLLLGSGDYTDTYFGITGDESVSSGLAAYDPDGGLVEAGLEVSARYDFNERWGVEGILSYNKLLGDAADSPIVEQGSDEILRLEVGLTRRISLDF
ncbi:MAG: MipA/OmpV family protein [Pseudoruegeria sp.]